MSLNPYLAGAPVGNSDAFVGRTEILDSIQATIKDLHQNAILLYGQRRIGKTSVLQELEIRLFNDGYCPIFIDWHEKEEWTLNKVLEELTPIISISLEQEKPVLSNDLPTAFKEWFSEQLLNSQNKPLVFLFDEFDVIGTSESANDVTDYLLQLLTLNPQRLNWIFSIGCKIEKLTDRVVEAFGGIENQFISYLDETETKKLIQLSESENNETLKWSTKTIEKILTLTAGQPFFTQQLCDKVWNYLYQEQPAQIPIVTLQTIDRVIPKILEETHSILEGSLWRELTVTEQVVVSALAQQKDWLDFIKPLEKIAKKLEMARDSLIEWELIHEDKGHYRFLVEIFRLWVEKNKFSFYDDLDLIEPYTQDIYQIADKLHKDRCSKNAQNLLKEVVQLNPYHTKANRLLAEIWRDEKQWVQARQVLENLYDYNPEAAKELLVQILLKLAESQENNQKPEKSAGWFEKMFFWWKSTFSADANGETQQFELYEQVLDIDRNNLIARKKKQAFKKAQKENHWKHRTKRFFVNHWREVLFIVTLVLSYFFVFFSETFPSEMILELEMDNKQTSYTLKGIPSSKRYELQSITISHDSVYEKNLPTFQYDNYQKIKLTQTIDHKNYLMDRKKLYQEFPNIQHFQYPHQDKLFDFVFYFTFKEQENHRKVNFYCDAFNTKRRSVPCAVKEKGYLSIFRGIPWYFMGTLLGIFLIIIGEIVNAIRKEPKPDNYGY